MAVYQNEISLVVPYQQFKSTFHNYIFFFFFLFTIPLWEMQQGSSCWVLARETNSWLKMLLLSTNQRAEPNTSYIHILDLSHT